MQPISFLEASQPLLTQMSGGGVFMSTRCQGKDNTMVVGWGGLTYFWGRPVFIAPVRHARFSKAAMDQTGVFTISLPGPDQDLAEALRFCGTKSGRDYDKFDGHGITAAKGREVDAPIVAECSLHLECVVRFAQEMPKETDPYILEHYYADGDLHTLYYGEVVACYRTGGA